MECFLDWITWLPLEDMQAVGAVGLIVIAGVCIFTKGRLTIKPSKE